MAVSLGTGPVESSVVPDCAGRADNNPAALGGGSEGSIPEFGSLSLTPIMDCALKRRMIRALHRYRPTTCWSQEMRGDPWQRHLSRSSLHGTSLDLRWTDCASADQPRKAAPVRGFGLRGDTVFVLDSYSPSFGIDGGKVVGNIARSQSLRYYMIQPRDFACQEYRKQSVFMR